MASGAQLASKDFIERVRDALVALSEGSSASPLGELSSIASAGKRYAVIGMGDEGNQTANFATNDHVELGAGSPGSGLEFENPGGSGITIDNGTAQGAGQINLPKGGIWKVQAWLTFQGGVATDQICCEVWNVTDAQSADGKGLMQKTYNNVGSAGLNGVPATAFVDCRDEGKTIELRILSGAGVQVIFAGSTNEGPTYMVCEQN